MRAVVVPKPGGPESLKIMDVPDPEPGPGEVVIDTIATAVNRADVLQRMGLYPPPPGASDVLGLECSGRISAVGEGVEATIGDEVCALLSGGGYAERVLVPAGQVLPLPPGVDVVTAAGIPEVAATVWSNVVMVAGLQPGDNFLVHGGAGGIGTFAIQLAKALGASVFATAGSETKLQLCRELGADVAINYRDSDFVDVLQEHGGADVILDNMGAKYLDRNVQALAIEGRLVIIGMQGGIKAELNIANVLNKRAAIIATSLRARPSADKSKICQSLVEHVWPLIGEGKIRPVIGQRVAFADVASAHEAIESGDSSGKILIEIA